MTATQPPIKKPRTHGKLAGLGRTAEAEAGESRRRGRGERSQSAWLGSSVLGGLEPEAHTRPPTPPSSLPPSALLDCALKARVSLGSLSVPIEAGSQHHWPCTAREDGRSSGRVGVRFGSVGVGWGGGVEVLGC